jgi:hypothetical protein
MLKNITNLIVDLNSFANKYLKNIEILIMGILIVLIGH